MPQNAHTSSQLRIDKFREATVAMLAILPMVVVASPNMAYAATIPVSFEFDNLLSINGVRIPGHVNNRSGVM